MRRAILFGVFILVMAVSTASFATPSELTGIETAVFSDREVVVIRHTGDASFSPRYLYDVEKGTIILTLKNVSVKAPKFIRANQDLLETAHLEQVKGMNQARLTLKVKDRAIVDRSLFRCGSYTEHILLVELFPSGENPKDEPPVRDLEGMLAAQPEDRTPAQSKMLDPAQLISVNAQPKQALDLMEKKNLVELDTKLTIISTRNGVVSSDNGLQGIKAALDEGAVSEVVFIGPKDKVQEAKSFLRTTRLSQNARTMNAGAENSVPSATRTEGIDSDYPPLQPGMQPDPFDLRNRLKGQLSDIMVNLPASGGYNFYGVLMLLSEMSGISIIIDPYLVDPPTGSRRDNLLEPPGNSEQLGGEGFRGAEEFRSVNLRGATNTVIGNFENVPFETALRIILEAHNLDYLVFSTPETDFSKPVILVSSRERIEQEIFGANEIDLYQAHYADPQALYQALDNMDLLPSRERGWNVYENPGGGSGGGGNNNQGGGGGNGGSGGSGGNGGSGGSGGSGGGGGPTGPGGGRSIMGYDVNPLERQALMLEFSPSARDERISELLAMAAREGLDILSVSFADGGKSAQGRILVIVLGE